MSFEKMSLLLLCLVCFFGAMRATLGMVVTGQRLD